MKRIIFYIILLCSAQKLYSQDKQVQGIVFDAGSKQRLTRVYIYNTRTEKGFYNNIKGEFTTTAAPGDVLIAALQGYGVDTIKIKTDPTIIFYLKRNSILLNEVSIRDSSLSPDERRTIMRREYKDTYRKADPQDILQIGGGNGAGGAGIGIDALWSLLSKEGKNARYLQKILERDYHDSMIDYRYTKSLVSRVTGLNGESLLDFMQQYRPGYYFILEANDYMLVQYIKTSFERYKQAPAANRLPPLKP